MNWSALSPVRWRAGLVAALGRFPLVILCGAIGAGCAIVGTHNAKSSALVGECQRLALTVALGLPLFFSLRILRERAAGFWRWALELSGIVILAVWFFTHSARPSDDPMIVYIRWALVLAALHMLAALAPYLWGATGESFWQWNRRLFLRFALTTLYTVVLTGGLELALLSADKLFDLKLKHAYGDLYFLIVGCFHPIFFLAGVPRDFAALDADREHPRGLKVFTQFALAPLVLVYGLILYAYAIKIIALRSWPHGWVALPVLILSGVGIFAALLLQPLRNEPNESWARLFGRVFPPALGPLALLLLLSVRVRISDYGVTEERYLGVVAAVWIMAWSLVFTLRPKAGIRWIPASLGIIAIAVAYGPWSAGAVSKRSQLARVIVILKTHGLWTETEAKSAGEAIELSHDEGGSLRSTLEYLVRVHGGEAIQPFFARLLPKENWTKINGWNGARAILTALNISVAKDSSSFTLRRKTGAEIDVGGFRRMWEIESLYHAADAGWSASVIGEFRLGLDHGVLKMAIGTTESPSEIPLGPVLSNLSPIENGERSPEQMQADFERDGRTFRIVFRNIQLQPTKRGPAISGTSFILLER